MYIAGGTNVRNYTVLPAALELASGVVRSGLMGLGPVIETASQSGRGIEYALAFHCVFERLVAMKRPVSPALVRFDM